MRRAHPDPDHPRFAKPLPLAPPARVPRIASSRQRRWIFYSSRLRESRSSLDTINPSAPLPPGCTGSGHSAGGSRPRRKIERPARRGVERGRRRRAMSFCTSTRSERSSRRRGPKSVPHSRARRPVRETDLATNRVLSALNPPHVYLTCQRIGAVLIERRIIVAQQPHQPLSSEHIQEFSRSLRAPAPGRVFSPRAVSPVRATTSGASARPGGALGQLSQTHSRSRFALDRAKPEAGLEPAARGLQNRCSAS
jgi:hypothetical protein